MVLSEEPRKGAGSEKGAGSGDNSDKENKPAKGKTGKTSKSRKDEEDDEDELDAELDSFGDDEDEIDEDIEEEEEDDDWEKSEEEDEVEEEEPFPPVRAASKTGGKGGRQKSVMEDFDVGDTDIFERDFYDDDDDDDIDVGRSSSKSSNANKNIAGRRLKPLNKNNNPAAGKGTPKGDDDPTADDPNENRKLK